MEPVESRAKLKVNEEGLLALRSLEGPLAPVIVIGPYRSGKSFLLNQLLNVSCGRSIAGCSAGFTVRMRRLGGRQTVDHAAALLLTHWVPLW